MKIYILSFTSKNPEFPISDFCSWTVQLPEKASHVMIGWKLRHTCNRVTYISSSSVVVYMAVYLYVS